MLNTVFGTLSTGVAASTNSYESISTVTVGAGGASNIEFSSIPSTYTHLQIRGIARTTATSATGDFFAVTFNSDTGANYSYHQLVGTGTATTALAGASGNSTYIQRFGTATQSSGIFGSAVTDILDYTNTNKYKTLRFLGGMDSNGDGWIVYGSGLWLSTSAITTIKLTSPNGNFVQYSQFALYGIKGS